jgi:hypothetical protein
VIKVTLPIEIIVDIFFVLNMFVNAVSGKSTEGNWQVIGDVEIDNDEDLNSC